MPRPPGRGPDATIANPARIAREHGRDEAGAPDGGQSLPHGNAAAGQALPREAQGTPSDPEPGADRRITRLPPRPPLPAGPTAGRNEDGLRCAGAPARAIRGTV